MSLFSLMGGDSHLVCLKNLSYCLHNECFATQKVKGKLII